MTAFQERRARLMAHMHAAGGGIAVIPTAHEVMRNSDADYPFRHDSYFYYLSAFPEPEAVVVLIAAGEQTKAILFCRDKNVEREIWDGFRFGPSAAAAQFGFDAAYAIEELAATLPNLMADMPTLFYSLGHDAKSDALVQAALASVRQQARAGIHAPAAIRELRPLLNEMRLIKDAAEIDSMQRAATIAAGAHARAMRQSKPGRHEYQVEAELLHEFRVHGAEGPAYTSIVATGANACVLHYRAGNAVLQDGDLVLIDAGCEFDSYASDITRTYPANGRFSVAQKELYEIVLAAQAAAIAAIKPGARFNDSHDAALAVLVQGMLDTGLLDGAKVGTRDDVIQSGAYRQFYMHRTGHWLGMDVHDVGDYLESPAGVSGTARPSRILQPGMVLTVEPGLYVRPAPDVPEKYWHIGIRIEDDVLVTADGRHVFSAAAPKTVAEIEATMAQAS